MNLYFSEVYKPENTLVYQENNQLVASLQMLPYRFTYYGTEVDVAYISGACTLPEFRNRGLMGKLLMASFRLMQERKIPLSVLIPAEKWLYAYYAKYGYEKIFDAGGDSIVLKDTCEKTNGSVEQAYALFDDQFRQLDFCMQKSKSDFLTILKDAALDDYPVKANLSGMARLIDVSLLLDFFARQYVGKTLILEIKDIVFSQNNGIYQIEQGNCKPVKEIQPDFVVDINTLCCLLMGYNLGQLDKQLAIHFEIHHPVMNLMLE